MNNRILKLIKQDLAEWGQYVLGFIGFIIAGSVVSFLIGIFFSTDVNFMNFNSGPDGIDLSGIFHLISFGMFVIVMLIAGIVAGSEIAGSVRKGISRTESFISETISATLVSLLIAPFILLMNMLTNVLSGSSSTFYNTLNVDGGLLTLGVQFLVYMAVFFIGFFIAAIWQKIGWLQTLSIIVFTLFATGALGMRTTNIVIDEVISIVQDADENVIVEESSILFGQVAQNGMTAVVALVAIIVFGVSTYVIIKSLPVKTV